MWRVEHAVSSAARKFKKIMSSKKKPTYAPDAAATATATTTLEDIHIDNTENVTHQAKQVVTTSASSGEKDKDSSSAEMGGPKATVPAPQMKKIASASA